MNIFIDQKYKQKIIFQIKIRKKFQEVQKFSKKFEKGLYVNSHILQFIRNIGLF
jgi:hypothetical protein